MKYLDEYQYGIYPYVPEHMELVGSQPAFENEGNDSAFQNVYGDPETRTQPKNYYDVSGNPSVSHTGIESSGRTEKLSPDEFEIWESQNTDNYGNWSWREAYPKKPYYFLGKQRFSYPDTQPLKYEMPADPYPYNYPHNLNLALDLIQEAISGENEDRLFYTQLLGVAPANEDRDIISAIRNDEMKHFELFRKLYYEHTGQILPPPAPYENGMQMTYCEGLKKALLRELSAVEKYRKILFAMQDRRHINILTEILTDEIKHADLYGLLLHINTCYAK